MPLPLFIGIAVVTGSVGLGKTVKAGFDYNKAKTINQNSNERMEIAAHRLDFLRKETEESLEALGNEKIYVLNHSIKRFLESFSKIKNVDFKEVKELSEYNKLHIDKAEMDGLEKLCSFSTSLVQGGVLGAASGALAAFGAYGAASTFAAASTGTAISSLSGVAASNATLAFFGGGSLASGGLGMAGGTVVLGGLVAGPALLVLGLVTGAKAGKGLKEAKTNDAKANEICAEFEAGSAQCIAIRRKAYTFYSLLSRLDNSLISLQEMMDTIIETEGLDYSKYSEESKKIISETVSLACSIKATLDTAILSEDGQLITEF